MGRCVEILLVGPIRLFLCLLALALPIPVAAAQTVHAENYDAFWLWAGVEAQPLLARARSLYILQGQVEERRGGAGGVRLIAQGGVITPAPRAQIWLAYRAHTLRWTPDILPKIQARISRWRAVGVPIAGLQIDFDARSHHLNEYADFLRGVRAQLSADTRLSITGLLDWGGTRDPADLNALGGVVDEVVIQTYQGRHTIPNYAAYLNRLDRLTFPFKIGLIQGGDWQAPADLASNPWFRGYVVFLKNGEPRTMSLGGAADGAQK
jgi:hypothetical protein